MLNEYLTEMTDAVKPWGGYINNFIGDAIVIVFGAPGGLQDLEWRSVQAAFAMRERLKELNLRRIERGDKPIDNGVGIASGRVIAGQMGSPDRCIYTVIGDTVNVAARIESLTRDVPDHAVLVNETVYNAIRSQPGVRGISLGEHHLKGRKEPVVVYAVEPAGIAPA
jgi:class 3 adenylate cyclase